MAIFIPLVTKFDSKGLDGAKRALANFQNFAVDVGRVAATAVAAVGVASVREASQFETTFAKIQGLVGLTADEIADLEKAARDLGPQFGKSGNEAADALFFITSAGLRGASAVDVLEASLKGSAIGLGNVEDIANAATAAMNTYGESNLSGTDAVEALAEAVRLGQFAPEELAGALGRVIPISAELGVTFQETTGLIASLTKGGLSASEAVTGIRGAMQAFIKPTAEAKKMLEQYGISTEDVTQSIEQDGFLATLSKLREAFGENTEDFTKVIGSIEGLSAVFSLTGENTEAYAEIVRLATDDIKIMDEALGFVSDTSQFKFDVAMASARDSLLEIGAAILDNMQPHLDTFIAWMEEHGPAIEEGFIKIFDAIDRIITSEVLADLVQHLKDMWPEVEQLGIEFGILMEELKPLTDLIIPALNALLVFTKDTVSDLGDSMNEFNTQLNIFDEEAPTTMKRIEEQGNGWARFINPRVWDAVSGLREYIRLQSQISSSAGITGPHSDPLSMTGLGRAKGGPVLGGQGYLVGEMGPELFIPNQGGGTIIPNNRMGGSNINITVNAGMGANGAQIGEQIVTAIKRYERTSGPVFASA